MRTPKPDDRQALGKSGEDYACRELERRGYAILARRQRTRFGEIDIIAMDAGVLVFIEVKARRTTAFGTPAESVTWRKQHRLQRLAAAYLAANRLAAQPCRFDVVTVRWPADRDAARERPDIAILKNAFETRSPERW
jgi:putative endonuclease